MLFMPGSGFDLVLKSVLLSHGWKDTLGADYFYPEVGCSSVHPWDGNTEGGSDPVCF